jgi:hypothetical protein
MTAILMWQIGTSSQRDEERGGWVMTVPIELVKGKIYLIRGQKVLLDSDLAVLYGSKPGGSMNRSAEIDRDFRKILCFS